MITLADENLLELITPTTGYGAVDVVLYVIACFVIRVPGLLVFAGCMWIGNWMAGNIPRGTKNRSCHPVAAGRARRAAANPWRSGGLVA